MHAEVENRRLKLKNWLDAVNGRWIDESRVEEMEEFERELFKSMLIAYQTGKGNHLVLNSFYPYYDFSRSCPFYPDYDFLRSCRRPSIQPRYTYTFFYDVANVVYVHWRRTFPVTTHHFVLTSVGV